MSASSSTVVTADEVQSSPLSGKDSSPGFKNPNNLYLITFLATLFLLLFVSCVIILRSYLMRRRFQRDLDEAFTAGIIFAPRSQGSHKRLFGHKPKMHTSWVVQGGEKWIDMMPVSALPVQAKRRKKTHTSSKHAEPRQPPEPVSVPSASFGWRLLHGIHSRDHTSHVPIRRDPATVLVDRLQVSVLIAMPSPKKPSNYSKLSLDEGCDNEELVPNIVFGVTRLAYKQSNEIT